MRSGASCISSYCEPPLHAAVATCALRTSKIVIQLCSRHAWPLIMLTSCSQPSSSMKPSELYPAAPIRRRARSRLGFALPPLLAPRLPVLQLRCSSCNRSSKRTAPRGQDEIRFFHFVCIYNNNVATRHDTCGLFDSPCTGFPVKPGKYVYVHACAHVAAS